MSAKAPFVLSDTRIYDVTDYCACYEEWNFEDEIVTHYTVAQRLHCTTHDAFDPKKFRKGIKKIKGLSGGAFAFIVIMAIEDVLEVHPKLPPPERWLVDVSRYHIHSWLEANGLSAHYHNYQCPIILRPFS
ncbi:hypothetical protein IAD21_00953 [Abditibacteriota bacterium]|nr:hypothetical protein IAD21_00953 [Abditibacteriota bacterium]